MKKFFKFLMFILIFAFLLIFLSLVMVRKGNGYGSDVLSFYNEPRNSLDLIFFGSSHSYATFSPIELEKQTNLVSYNFSTQQQPFWITYHYMIESLKYQKPKYWVMEVYMATVEDNYSEEGTTRDALDKMRFSVNKIKAINVSVPNESDRISYYINIIKYHSRWNDIKINDFTDLSFNHLDINKGFTYLNDKVGDCAYNDVSNITDKKELTKKNSKYLYKIIELAKENNIELIFVVAPYKIKDEHQMIYNTIFDIAKDNSIRFINYNLPVSDLTVDYSKDFYDSGHVNGKAAYKITDNLAKILIEK